MGPIGLSRVNGVAVHPHIKWHQPRDAGRTIITRRKQRGEEGYHAFFIPALNGPRGGVSMRLSRLLFLAFLLAALLPNDLKPQTTTSGALAGVVTDPSQAVVPERSAGSETVGMTSWT